MIESVFLILIIMSFILFLVSLEAEAFALNIMTAISWTIVMVSSMYIEVPGVSSTYTELTINAFCMMFIFSSIILAVVNFLHFKKESEVM